jgi:hypothetical protein
MISPKFGLELGFALVTIVIGYNLMASGWRHPHANRSLRYAGMTALVLFTMWARPHMLGHDWYYEGFFGGPILGDFFGSMTTRQRVIDEQIEATKRGD